MKADAGLFKAGAAKVDITPPLGTRINGDFITHYAHTIHDPLYSKALVLENKNITIAFIVVDICHMRKDFIDEIKIDKREGKADTTVCYLAIQGINGEWISLLANYSMHYAGDWENGTITADYFGVFARQMQARLHASESFVAIMTNGTSGDANILDFLQPDRYPKAYFEKSTLIGSDIAEKVIASMKSLEWETAPSLSTHYNALEIEVRKPSFIELQEARKLVQNTRYEYLSLKNSDDTGTSHTGNEDVFRRIYAREQILLDTYPDTILFPVQVFKIGSVVIGGLGGEFFSETGIWLKEKSNIKNYFTICLANGYTGYVPPEHEFELGGYETWRCRGSYLAINAEDKIRNTLLNLMN